jgi:hypothetical protein
MSVVSTISFWHTTHGNRSPWKDEFRFAPPSCLRFSLTTQEHSTVVRLTLPTAATILLLEDTLNAAPVSRSNPALARRARLNLGGTIMGTYPPPPPPYGGVGQRIEEAIELIEMEIRHAAAYVNDAVIPQVRVESISALRNVANSLRNFADRLERNQPPPGAPPKGPTSA